VRPAPLTRARSSEPLAQVDQAAQESVRAHVLTRQRRPVLGHARGGASRGGARSTAAAATALSADIRLCARSWALRARPDPRLRNPAPATLRRRPRPPPCPRAHPPSLLCLPLPAQHRPSPHDSQRSNEMSCVACATQNPARVGTPSTSPVAVAGPASAEKSEDLLGLPRDTNKPRDTLLVQHSWSSRKFAIRNGVHYSTT
jgi:hypothetical protein